MGRFDDPAAKVPRDQLEELAFEQKPVTFRAAPLSGV
jgi:hypothetical protein